MVVTIDNVQHDYAHIIFHMFEIRNVLRQDAPRIMTYYFVKFIADIIKRSCMLNIPNTVICLFFCFTAYILSSSIHMNSN